MRVATRKKTVISLTGILIALLLVLGGYLAFQHLMSEPITLQDIEIDSRAALKLDQLKQVSKKNGIREWELTAVSARLLKGENKAELDEVSVYFFTDDHQMIDLTSDKGVLDTQSHDMTFSGNVVIIYAMAILRTDKLHYDKKEHIISSQSPVRLEKDGSFIEANTMTIRLNENRIVLDGQVKGLFHENFSLEFE